MAHNFDFYAVLLAIAFPFVLKIAMENNRREWLRSLFHVFSKRGRRPRQHQSAA